MALPILAIGTIVSTVIGGLDKLFTSDEERELAKIKLIEQLQQPHILQALTSLKEAEHASMFVAGWRPAIGWICAAGLGYQFLIFPLLTQILFVLGFPGSLPNLDVSVLMTMTLSLLGLGGMRTFEKTKGVARSTWDKEEIY